MTRSRTLPVAAVPLFVALLLLSPVARGEQNPADLDQKVIAEAKASSEALKNLTYLCDEIGPRLTGSKNLQRANEWCAKKMKDYGLTNVHQEAWEMPEGWERGTVSARLIEPDNGIRLSFASAAWTPGTNGKIQCDVVVLKAATSRDLAAYKGKLKGVAVLTRPPVKLLSPEDFDKPGVGSISSPIVIDPSQRTFLREVTEFLTAEGAAAILTDSAKPYGLLDMSGGWQGKDRPSAANRTPRFFVAHQHYEMLYRLATRPEPARTRLEIEATNKFIPGPLAVFNTVGEIRGSDKPDEIVVVGAHLDSWDLGQGATDNASGSITVLEAARVLMKSGVKPRRTIRFVLFTGEEQGLRGSAAYVEKHKDEMARISACLVHDTGTGKVVGLDVRHRPPLQPVLAKELVSLKELGVVNFNSSFISGSDHASFERAGVPGLMFRQEISGYRLSHHSQADTTERIIESNLIQGVQVMAVSALRIANREGLLPREKTEAKPKEPAAISR